MRGSQGTQWVGAINAAIGRTLGVEPVADKSNEITVEKGHGRIEWRGIQLMKTTPAQMGFPFAEQLGRLDRFRYHLKTGKFEVETVWVITSLTAAKAGAVRLLELARPPGKTAGTMRRQHRVFRSPK